MVAAKPTGRRDLRHTRTHHFLRPELGEEKTICRDCWVEINTWEGLWGIPPCPGPGYMLLNRSTQKIEEAEGQHKREPSIGIDRVIGDEGGL